MIAVANGHFVDTSLVSIVVIGFVRPTTGSLARGDERFPDFSTNQRRYRHSKLSRASRQDIEPTRCGVKISLSNLELRETELVRELDMGSL